MSGPELYKEWAQKAQAEGRATSPAALPALHPDEGVNRVLGIRMLHDACTDGVESKACVAFNQGGVAPDDVMMGRHSLIRAANAGNANIVQLLLSRDASLEIRDEAGQTALHAAAAGGDAECTLLISGRVNNLEWVDSNQRTALVTAAVSNKTDAAKVLTAAGSDLEAQDCLGRTAMSWAAQHNNADMMLLLIENGANPYLPDKRGRTPLHWAAGSGSQEAAILLLEKGAQAEAPDIRHRTPLHAACEAGKGSMVQLLADEAQASLVLLDELGRTPLHVAVGCSQVEATTALLGVAGARGDALRAVCGVKDLQGASALHIAARLNEGAVHAQLLVNAGSDIESTDNEGMTALRYAARSGYLDTVKILIDGGADLNAQDLANVSEYHGETALMLAVRNGHNDVAKLLASSGANINARDLKGMSAFHSAASSGQTGLVSYLIEAGADINALDHQGKTPAFLASEKGLQQVVRVLASHKADLGVCDLDGRSALHWCADNQQGECMLEALVSCGADINQPDSVNQSSPLHLAAARGLEQSCRILVASGANVRAKDLHKQTPLHTAARCSREGVFRILMAAEGSSCNDLDTLGQTPLHLAAAAGQLQIARLCIQSKTPVNVVDGLGMTALHLAAKSGSAQVTQLLCAQGAAVDVESDAIHQTALHLASSTGNGCDVAQALLRAGAYHGARDSEGLTPLMAAARVGDTQTVSLLARAVEGDGISCRDHSGRSALFWAAAHGHVRSAEALVEAGAVIQDAVEASGCTMLHIAVENNQNEMVKWLLSTSAATVLMQSADSEYNVTPLSVACAAANVEAVVVLVEAGANPDIIDNRGRTSLHWAAEAGVSNAVSALIQAGADVSIRDKEGNLARDCATSARVMAMLE